MPPHAAPDTCRNPEESGTRSPPANAGIPSSFPLRRKNEFSLIHVYNKPAGNARNQYLKPFIQYTLERRETSAANPCLFFFQAIKREKPINCAIPPSVQYSCEHEIAFLSRPGCGFRKNASVKNFPFARHMLHHGCTPEYLHPGEPSGITAKNKTCRLF